MTAAGGAQSKHRGCVEACVENCHGREALQGVVVGCALLKRYKWLCYFTTLISNNISIIAVAVIIISVAFMAMEMLLILLEKLFFYKFLKVKLKELTFIQILLSYATKFVLECVNIMCPDRNKWRSFLCGALLKTCRYKRMGKVECVNMMC